jgi:hypothetical protein
MTMVPPSKSAYNISCFAFCFTVMYIMQHIIRLNEIIYCCGTHVGMQSSGGEQQRLGWAQK